MAQDKEGDVFPFCRSRETVDKEIEGRYCSISVIWPNVLNKHNWWLSCCYWIPIFSDAPLVFELLLWRTLGEWTVVVKHTCCSVVVTNTRQRIQKSSGRCLQEQSDLPRLQAQCRGEAGDGVRMRPSVDRITLRVHSLGKKSSANIFDCDHLNLGVKMTARMWAFRIYPIWPHLKPFNRVYQVLLPKNAKK